MSATAPVLHLRSLLLCGLAGLALLAAPGVQAAGVKVTFVEIERYGDAGDSLWERDANLAVLGSHLSSLGQRLLPADMTLEVEVLDVDLAGTVRPSMRGGDLRVVKGRADFPRMTLRYSLIKDGQVQASATEHLADLTYTMQRAYGASDPLRYEKRMLEDWLRTRFADRIVAAR